ncbi:helix-turn-helix transcriptional regulator [Clostridium sp. MB40-C1]|uniref:helix-turn-helix domain-containing protein n=1 Tax=Clostridium sp. MB40-C1 TaxID=3070996 RepID=UPI0027E0C028|nr:helix-turn-helix transcriptional regulator [Clostridium sp. MB40-C1]WMJ79571.1 helix-turn-helix transcriptional regulator [Clostridium sp. MB40-C1]
MNFKLLRKSQNLSLRQAAQKLGVTYQSVCRYENKGRVPKDEVLAKMLVVYKCTEQELGQAVINNIKIGRESNEN